MARRCDAHGLLPLGAWPLDQAQRLRCQLGSLAKKPAGVTVAVNAEDADAAERVKQAETVSGESWAKWRDVGRAWARRNDRSYRPRRDHE